MSSLLRAAISGRCRPSQSRTRTRGPRPPAPSRTRSRRRACYSTPVASAITDSGFSPELPLRAPRAAWLGGAHGGVIGLEAPSGDACHNDPPICGTPRHRHRFRIFSPACLPNSSVSAPIFEAATPQSLIRGCSPAATQAGILIHKPCNCDWAISASTRSALESQRCADSPQRCHHPSSLTSLATATPAWTNTQKPQPARGPAMSREREATLLNARLTPTGRYTAGTSIEDYQSARHASTLAIAGSRRYPRLFGSVRRPAHRPGRQRPAG